MKKLLGIIALVCAFYVSGCGSNAVNVSLTPSSAEAIDDGQAVNITAAVMNDSASKGVSWTLSGPGALANATATSVTYNAPASGSGSATITAASVADTTKTASVTITVTSAPSITTTSLPGGVVGTAYSQQLAETGGAGTLTWSVSAGSLPSGLTLSNSGVISGTPTGPASTTPVSFTVKVTDSSVASPQSTTQALSITISQAPTITSANNATFVVSTAGTFSVTATGVPTPTLSETGALPSGVTFVDNGNGTATLSGTPASGTAGSYPITIKAHNGIGTDASQSFTLTVGQPPAITSASTTTFTVGTAGTFNVTTTGFPVPSLSETGALPSGVTFVDNGNGTAKLSGTPASATGGTYSITIKAHNGIGTDATQNFTLTVDQTPAITSANSATFTVATLGTFNVTATGFPTPSIAESGALPTGVTFVDNGNGTGTLAGTPAPGTVGNYPITFTPSNGVGSPTAQSFTLTVGQAPAITSANNTTFTVGSAGTFTVTTTGFPKPTLSDGGATLPSGVSFVDNGDGTATLSGTPGAGTGGTNSFTITASNGVGSSATQNFTLTVDQAPAITSANNTTFTVGAAGTFSVTTSGFPKPSLSDGGATLPSGVTFVDNGNGTATLSGTPASGTNGSYPFTITASNGVGSNATQSFTLTVNTAPVITSANNTTFTVGTAGTFSITTSGTPTPSLSDGGATLPSGVTFVDNGNGTATLSGTPGAGTGGLSHFTITASNGVGSNATQNFTLTVDQAPAITSLSSTTFTEGVASLFTVTTATTTYPTASLTEAGSLPSGVTFTDNGDGTAKLSGTPASGSASGSPYSITFTASNGVGSNAVQNFTLTVNTAPVITSASSTTFTVGTAGSFNVTTTGSPTPTLTETSTLPGGVTFTDNANGTGTLGGTPAASTGGSYPITIKAQSSSGNTSQSFTLTVNEAPAITSSDHTTFTEGQSGNFMVNTSGFPKPSLSEVGTLPSGVTFADNGDGTGSLSGTPATGTSGSYPVTITANSGIGTPAAQVFTLTVVSDPCATAGTGGESMLSGNYAFLLKGFDNGQGAGETQPEPALVGGVLTFNGSGSITSGTIDMNLNSTAGVQSNSVTSGSYKIGTSGSADARRVCMAITTAAGTQHYRASLGNISSGVASTGHMIDFDTAGPFTAGTLRKQSATIPTTLSGNFAFGASSADNSAKGGGKYAAVGFLGFSSGGTVNSGGELDDNKNGNLNAGNCTGSFLSPCTPESVTGGSYTIASNGRGTLTLNLSISGTPNSTTAKIYAVSSSEVFILTTDDQTLNNLYAGTALQRSGSFSNSSLSNNDVVYTSALQSNGGTPTSSTMIGRISIPSSGNFNFFAYQNDGGTVSRQPSSGTQAGTYSIDSNGRMLLTSGAGTNPPVFYLVTANKAFLLGSSQSVESGMFEPQGSTSASGTYAFGTIDSATSNGGDSEGIATFSGGNVSGASDDNSSGGQNTNPISGTFSVDSTGFGQVPGTCTPTSPNCDFIFFVISSTRAVGTDGSSQNPTIQTVDQ